MTYLFGDSTPFPMDDNFIEGLSCLIDTAAALLRIDEELEQGRERSALARSTADADLARLDALAEAIAEGLQPHMNEADPGAGQTAVRIFEAARSSLEDARAAATARREAELRGADGAASRSGTEVLRACEDYVCRWEFPGTVWDLRWQAGITDVGSQAVARGATPFGLDVTVDLEIPAAHRCARPFRVADLRRGVSVGLPSPAGLLRRGARVKRESLDRYYVWEIESSADRASVLLRRGNKQLAPGLLIVLRDRDRAHPTVQRMGEDGSPGEVVIVDGEDALALGALWSDVHGALADLASRRNRLARGTLDGVRLQELERPALLATRMIGAVSPLVREIRRRSAASDELVLKREVGSGRREEIYLGCDELVARYGSLAPRRRALFGPLGLESDDAQVLSSSDLVEVDDVITSTRRSGPRLVASR